MVLSMTSEWGCVDLPLPFSTVVAVSVFDLAWWHHGASGLTTLTSCLVYDPVRPTSQWQHSKPVTVIHSAAAATNPWFQCAKKIVQLLSIDILDTKQETLALTMVRLVGWGKNNGCGWAETSLTCNFSCSWTSFPSPRKDKTVTIYKPLIYIKQNFSDQDKVMETTDLRHEEAQFCSV